MDGGVHTENALSQSDIDALMRALLPASGDDLFQTRGGAVRSYDFRRPTKFKKDVLRTLVMVHDNFARLLQSYLIGNLRTGAQLHVRSTNQYSFAEFTQLIPNPSVIALFRMDPLPGMCLLELSPNIAFAIVDRVFGGGGADAQPQRALSEIELGVIQRVVSDMMLPLQEAWRNVAEVAPRLERIETNPVFLQATVSSDVVAAITLAVEIGEHLGHLCLVFPHTAVDPVLSRLTASTLMIHDRNAVPGDAREVERTLAEAPVSVEVRLGSSQLTVQEFMRLKVGDVIPLGTGVNEELRVYVGDRLTFFGRAGVVGHRFGVEITRCVAANQR